MRKELWVPPAAIALLVAAYVLNPHLVYDQFIWKYYWGPIVADGAGGAVTSPGGVTAQPGYNWVNTITWALILGGSLLGVLRVLDRLGMVLRIRFIAAALPFIVFGSTARALEDANVLGPPLEYAFITPLIYVLMFVLVFGALFVGELLQRRNVVDRDVFVAGIGTLLLAANVVMILGRLDYPGANPIIPVEAAAMGLLLAGAVYVIGQTLHLTFLTTPLGVGVVAAHMFDASSTFLGYGLGYVEKHVLPTLLIDLTGTAAAMFPLKLAIVIPVLYYLDEWGEDEEVGVTFNTLLYLTILVLGLGPGTRNVTRMAMGV